MLTVYGSMPATGSQDCGDYPTARPCTYHSNSVAVTSHGGRLIDHGGSVMNGFAAWVTIMAWAAVLVALAIMLNAGVDVAVNAIN